jgi:hypothetical protein
LRYASTISYERRAREWDREQLTQEKLLAADQSKQDEENRPLTYVTKSLIVTRAACAMLGRLCFWLVMHNPTPTRIDTCRGSRCVGL